MNNIIETMLSNYKRDTLNDRKNSVKEVLQEMVLCGLSRAGFFKYAAFYGGTALRIFYGLDRFSEDLDFSLKVTDSNFDLATFFPVLEKEMKALGLNFEVEEKVKTAQSNVKSAFLKGNTKELMLLFYADKAFSDRIAANEVVKIKFEVDTTPPEFATFEKKYRMLPYPYELELYDLPSLFAGKIHAVICRGWKNRVKGRDLYDYVFYLAHNARVNLKHLTARLKQSGYFEESSEITIDDVKDMLVERFDGIDYEQAKQDVAPFIKDTRPLDIWCAEFFIEITKNLKAE
jgi:predicted nucleotidyltransferase component of viral defense system